MNIPKRAAEVKCEIASRRKRLWTVRSWAPGFTNATIACPWTASAKLSQYLSIATQHPNGQHQSGDDRK
jgi:hypothetical protein